MDAHLQRQITGRIKQARIEAGYTQVEMADLLNMTMRGYQHYESGRVPFKHLEKIAALTNVTQMWLLRGDLPGEGATPQIEGLGELVDRIEQVELAVESLRQVILAAFPGVQPSSPPVARPGRPARQA